MKKAKAQKALKDAEAPSDIALAKAAAAKKIMRKAEAAKKVEAKMREF